MLLRTHGKGRNAWHIAAYGLELGTIKNRWELAKQD